MNMRKLLLFLACTFTSLVTAQETFTYANPDKDFFDGQELFVQKKYAASEIFLERFIKNRDGKAESDIVQEANYYIACNAYELRKENAEMVLEQYLKRYPYTQFEARCWFMLGNLAFEKKQYKKSAAYYENIKEKRINKAERAVMNFNKGYSYIEQKEYAKARTFLKKVKGTGSKYEHSAAYYIAYSNYAQKNYDEALQEFLAIENIPEYSGFVPYYIIQIYYYQKDYENLMPYAEKILARKSNNPNDAEVYRIMGECSYDKGIYDRAIKNLTEYEKLSKKVVRNDMYILGISYYKTEDYKNAAKRLTKVTSVKDSLAQNAYLHLGNSYVKTNEKNNARMAYQSAAEMNFDTRVKEEAAYNYTVTTFETTTPFGESIKAFEDFLQKYPNSKYKDRINERLVTVYMNTRNYAAASESLAKLKTLSPELKDVKAYIYFQVGTEDFVRGDYAKAIENFNLAEKTATSDFKLAQVIYWRGESKYRLGIFDEARADFLAFFNKKGATEFENYNLANYNIAYTYFQEKDYKNSIPYFQKYISNEKNENAETYVDALDRMGDAYFVSRDLIQAEKYYTISASKAKRTGDYASFQRGYVQGLRKNYNGKIQCLNQLIVSYPKSTYVDDSYYEIARAYVLLEQHNKAIETYQTLISKYPQSPLSRKGLLEIGMLYYYNERYDDAINVYKKVVATYPNSEETRTALETLENIYIEQNDVENYFAYTRTLGNIVVEDPTKEDSLTYLAAERLYMKSEIAAATGALERYIGRFCSETNGRFCLSARFYLADCYYNSERIDDAYGLYSELSKVTDNPYMEQVLIRLSKIAYDKQEYSVALTAFKTLQVIAQEPDNVTAAKIGVLRCSYLLNDAQTTIAISTNILSEANISKELETEARFYLAKAYLQIDEVDKANQDFTILAKDMRTETGAEAKYLVANYYFRQGKDKKAEEEVTDFIQKGTPHQYWLARAFVLLADIYILRGDDFQAKQYLMSLKSNYKNQDSIQDLIEERLDGISAREQETIVE